jgi:cation diffusion facilitator family transporter
MKPTLHNKSRLIKLAALISLAGNTVLALLKIGAGWMANSSALVSDGIDSSVDVLVAVMTLAVVRIMARPADKEHPWGHGRAETMGTTVLAFLIFFAGAQVVVQAISTLVAGGQSEVPGGLALVVSGVSVAGKLLLSWSQYAMGRRAQSAILKANAKNMAGDVLISLGVLVGVGASIAMDMPVLDPVVAGLVGLWVVRTAVCLFLETNTELMDGNTDTAAYRTVFAAVCSVPGAHNPHRARMRRIAGLWDVDIDIEVAPQLTVEEAHRIACEVEFAIKNQLDNIYDIVVHVEPRGGKECHAQEGYGLSAGDLKIAES